jgi:hypothetical protein
MRKHITFGISAALITGALVLWTMAGVLGSDAHTYGPRIELFASSASFNPYLPIRELEPAY